MELRTERLVLRQWREDDLEPFAKMCGDARVMEYFPAVLTREESDALAARIKNKIEENGWGCWAVTLLSGEFIGFIGINGVGSEFPFGPAVEIGWRLAFDHWGKGYAVEGALASLRFGFDVLGLEKIVAFTAACNLKSRRVMEKLGMHYDPKDDFDHPKVAEGHPHRRQVLYQIKKGEMRCN